MGRLSKSKAFATMKASVTIASLERERGTPHPFDYQTFSLLSALLILLWELLRL